MIIHIPHAFRLKYSANYRQLRQSYSIRYGNTETFRIYTN